jgi:hypothetical protein
VVVSGVWEGHQDQTIQAHNLFLPPLLLPELPAVSIGPSPEAASIKSRLKGRNGMDIGKILAELKAEREQIEEAVLSLERLARGRGRSPGKPHNWMADVTTPKRRGRPPGSKNKFHLSYDPLSEPPAVEIGVRVPNPKPKPKLPPATAEADLPASQPIVTWAVANRKPLQAS